MSSRARRAGAWWRVDALVACIGALLLMAWDFSGLDLWFASVYGARGGFAWRDAWLTRTLLHDQGRLLGWAAFGALAFNVVRPLWAGPTRAERLRWVGVTLVCLLLIPAIKRYSATSCPWDLVQFGGHALYVSHWSFGVSDGGTGHCFPSGHATAAFAFLGGWFVLRDHHTRAARAWLAGVVLAGLAFGWAQLARGAHYPSHTLWTAWLCWAVWSAAVWLGRADTAPVLSATPLASPR
jgi:membrane-associated PAP2 superfamily phosphatase